MKEKIKALEEYDYLTETTISDIVSDEEQPFWSQISRAQSIQEVNVIRINLFLTYSEYVLNQCQVMISAFSRRITNVKEYNDRLSDLGERLEVISKMKRAEEEIIDESKIFFEEVWKFFKRIRKSEADIIQQGRKYFWGSLFPIWGGIFSVGWISLISLFLYLGKINFSATSISLIVLGWFVIVGVVGIVLKIIVYGVRDYNKDTSRYLKGLKLKEIAD